MAKNYITFVNDHSGSMGSIRHAALTDYNANITAFKDAATREMLDTIVSVIGVGLGNGYRTGRSGFGVKRQTVVSNPHVLKPLTTWNTDGGTPLYDGIGDAIDLCQSVPDASDENVSFLIFVTTDGEEMHSEKWNEFELRQAIQQLQATGRYTFVFRVPRGHAASISHRLGVPLGNVQEWGTTAAGMAESTAATTAAVNQFYAARSAGQKSSTVFYASAAAVDTSALKDITNDVSLYVVPQFDPATTKLEIRDFILTKRMKYLKGSAFYQLTKTEPRVQPSKLIAVRDRTTGKIYAGKEARQMLGLPTDRNVRLHPGDHGNFDLFIQSSSVNRHLVPGTGVIYWEAIGVEFTDADLAYLQPKAAGPVQLPAVAPTNKPTANPLKTPKAPAQPKAALVGSVSFTANTPASQPLALKHIGFDGRVRYHLAPAGATFFATRDGARAAAKLAGKKAYDQGPGFKGNNRHYIA